MKIRTRKRKIYITRAGFSWRRVDRVDGFTWLGLHVRVVLR